MKKIYLLSAAACMFALSANAAGEDDMKSWGAQGTTAVWSVSGSCVHVTKDASANTWDCQFNPPTWIAPGKGKDEAFEIKFDAKYTGEGTDGDMTGEITFIQGRQFGGYPGDDATIQALCESLGVDVVTAAEKWKIQGAINQLTINEYTDQAEDFNPGVCNRNVHFFPTEDWETFSMKGTLGRHAADSVDLEFEFGKMAGAFDIKNFQFIVNGKVFYEAFMEAGAAVNEAAAVQAFVANDVIFASEAADVVVYNINGVAVKSAKNVTSLSVADLKAGLYIAKVGNATVKFVK
jgi:hypothetical protein